MKNIDKNNKISDIDDNSLEGLSQDDIAKKFEKQMDKLKKIAKNEIHEETRDDLDALKNKEKKESNYEINEDLDKQVDNYFDQVDKEFEEINTQEENNVVVKYKNISKRNIDIQKAIIKSWESVLDEILNWKEQKSVVSRSLLKIANWILNTEK